MKFARSLLRKALKPGLLFLIVAPATTFAHEVYVLSPEQIMFGLTTPAFSPLIVIMEHPLQFVAWAVIGVVLVALIFATSIAKRLERICDPLFARARHYAPMVTRVTAGLAFLACAYHNALFGPELMLSDLFGEYAGVVRVALAFIGLLILAGLWARAAAILMGAIFIAALYERGLYIFTYTNYLGTLILLLLLGAHAWSIERTHKVKDVFGRFFAALNKRFGKYSLLILRVCFGISLLISALYAKFFHNMLAYQVASLPLGHTQTLAALFNMEPHFLVVGAGVVEIVLALFIILGIEIRFTAIFLELWLALSLYYFGESVWPHLILIGIPIALFLYGYDKYSLEGRFFKKGRREPIL